MKYCSKCKKVYPDGVDCKCTKEKRYSWEDPYKMVELDCEAKCKKCGSTEDLTYHKPFKYITIKKTDPSYCTCAECDKKLQAYIAREEAMKYLIIDNYNGENEFCEDKDAVEEYLDENYARDWDGEPGKLDVIILKLEPIESVKESDFKPVWENRNPETGEYNREPNTHIVFWEGEMFRVEEVSIPKLEYDGGRSINW